MSRKKNHLLLRGVFVLLEQLEPHQACSPLGALSVKKHPQRGHTLRAGVVELFRGWDEFLNSDTGSCGGCVGMKGTWGCKLRVGQPGLQGVEGPWASPRGD